MKILFSAGLTAMVSFGAAVYSAPVFAPGAGYASWAVYSRAGDPSSWTPGVCSFDLDGDGTLCVFDVNRYIIRDPGGTGEQQLYDFGGSVYGSFLRIMGATVYFGETSNQTVKCLPLSGGAPTDLFTLEGNYECDFNGQSQLIISANPEWTGSKLYAWWAGLTAPRLFAELGNASGPVAIDRNDSLGYGCSDFFSETDEVVFFTATQVAEAIQGGVPLVLEDGARFAVMTNPANFAFDRDTPAQNLFVSSWSGMVWRVSGPHAALAFARGSSPFTMRFRPGRGDYSAFCPGGGRLYVLDTDWSDYASAIFVVEPCPQNLVIGSGDYRGDGTSLLAVFRSERGMWAVRDYSRFYFGKEGDLPVSGDYDGDGTAGPALFRAGSGLWVQESGSRFYFGKIDDIPLPRDYDEIGGDDAALFRPASALWAVRSLTRFNFGAEGDIPVPDDYAAIGRAWPAVFRPASGWWAVRGLTEFFFGAAGDLPVPGDYSGDGTARAAIFRPGEGLWSVRGLTRFYLGISGDWPVPADYDGNGTVEAGIVRTSLGLWAARWVTRAYFGASGDFPAAR